MTQTKAPGALGTVIQFVGKQEVAGFSVRDLLEFQQWDSGGRRFEVDPCVDRSGLGQFAMIYHGDDPWASWALSRDGASVLVWDCVTLADLGRFANVRDALAALPGGKPKPQAIRRPAEVISFSAFQARRPAA